MGTSLALWLLAAGAELQVIAGRDAGRPLDPRLPKVPRLGLAELASGEADLLLLAVPDGALAAVAEELSSRPQAKVALHVSGPLGAEVLASLRRAGSAIGTLHPLRAFPAVLAQAAGGTFYALDGDATALMLAKRLTRVLGGEVVEVAGERRQLYHLAATLAAGGVTTVLAVIAELVERAALPKDLLGAYLHLMDGALEASRQAAAMRASAEDFDRAITGPAVRGDEVTLERQRAALVAVAPRLLPIVGALQEEALRRGQSLRGAAALKAISSENGKPPVLNPERE